MRASLKKCVVVLCAAAALSTAACGNAGKFNGGQQANQRPTVTVSTASPDVTDTSTAASASPAAPVTPSPAPPQAVSFGDHTVAQFTGTTGFTVGAGNADSESSAGEVGKELYLRGTKPFWSNFFGAAGLGSAYYDPAFYPVSGASNPRTQCTQSGTDQSDAPSFYCVQDGDSTVHGGVYLNIASYWAALQAVGDQPTRNYVAAVVAANLFAYHVARELSDALHLPGLTDDQTRLMASCLTAIWVRGNYPTGKSTPAATHAAVAAFDEAVRLPRLNSGAVLGDLKAAFDLGLTSGSVVQCGNAYWDGTVWS